MRVTRRIAIARANLVAAAAIGASLLASGASAAPPSDTGGTTPAKCLPSLIAATSGGLDQGFACRGVQVTSAADSTPAAPVHYDVTDLAVQPDNKIVVVGRRMNQIGNSSDTLVLRYTAGGNLDATFGTGGVTVVNASGSGFGFESARGTVLQPDGAIVVVGTSSDETVDGTRGYILRLTPAGALDTTFGGTGVVQIAATHDATAVASDGAGGFYVVGKKSSPTRTAQFTHVLSNGTLDPAFGTGGTMAITYAGGEETGEALAQAPGAIAMAGLTAFAVAWGNLGVNRFSLGAGALATLDPTFSGDGRHIKGLGGKGTVGDAILTDDLVLFVGGAREMGSPATNRYALTRFTAAGAAVTATSVFPLTTESGIDALVRTSSRILAAGYARTGSSARMALAAYTLSGTLDTTFSGDGLATYNLGGDVRATAVGVQSTGRIVMAGRRQQSSTSPGAVVLVGVVP